MMSGMLARVHAWVGQAPWVMLLVVISALAVFWWVLRTHDVPGWAAQRARWLNITVQAVVLPLLVFLILWGMRITLARTEYDFRRQHGRVSQANLESVEKIWGRPHVQRDLVVNHYYMRPVTEEVKDELGRIIMRTRMERVDVPQNSVTRTRGDVTLTRSERQKGTAKYPGFFLQCHFLYTVKNFANRQTEAEFTFPLSPEQSKFDHFTVLVNGQDQSAHLNLDAYSASWTLPMSPGQVDSVDISYDSQGLQRFYYQVADVREIRDFVLALNLPDIPPKSINYPEGCIPPTTIAPANQGRGSLLTWKLDRALTTRGMGVALPNPAQPGELVARVLRSAWRGGMLLVVTLVLTAIVLGLGFSVLRTALIAGIYVGEFMALAALTDVFPAFWLPWALTALVAIILSALVLGGRKASGLLLALVVIFMALYPLLALPEDISPSLLLGMDVLIIIYLAVLGALALRKQPEPMVEEVEAT
ncbi:MAG TPA: hypothetical protein VGL77_15955 [Armatimonadota bacterium]|jgi:hypothetical protein